MRSEAWSVTSVVWIVLLLAGCGSTTVKDNANSEAGTGEANSVAQSSAEHSSAGGEQEIPLDKRIYYLQHRLIPDWVFQSEGEFFFDIYNGQVDQLMDAVADLVSPEYARQIDVTPLYDKNAVVIRFPPPEEMPQCFYVLVKKRDDGFHYYTYEKAMNFGDDSVVGVLGGWDSEGSHQNYGPRSYSAQQDFVSDVLGLD